MTKYRVSGADRESGVELELVVDADSEQAAAKEAERRGIRVSGIVKTKVMKRKASSQPIEPDPSSVREGRNYSATLVIAAVLRVIGVLQIVVGIILLIRTAVASTKPVNQEVLFANTVGPADYIPGVTVMIYGIIVFGSGESFQMLREITLNTRRL